MLPWGGLFKRYKKTKQTNIRVGVRVINHSSRSSSLPNSESTRHRLIGRGWKVSPTGVTPDWMTGKASNILTHTLHLR